MDLQGSVDGDLQVKVFCTMLRYRAGQIMSTDFERHLNYPEFWDEDPCREHLLKLKDEMLQLAVEIEGRQREAEQLQFPMDAEGRDILRSSKAFSQRVEVSRTIPKGAFQTHWDVLTADNP